MWWHRSKSLQLIADRQALHVFVRERGRYRLLESPLLGAFAPAELSLAIAAVLQAHRPTDLTVALSWDWAPGVVVDFGVSGLPAKAHQAHAHARMREIFGAVADDWQVVTDAQRVNGPQCVFGVPRACIAAVTDNARALRIRRCRVEPALGWSWRVGALRDLRDGWWLIDHGASLTVVLVGEHLPRQIDHVFMGGGSTTPSMQEHLARLALRHGVTNALAMPHAVCIAHPASAAAPSGARVVDPLMILTDGDA